MTAKRQQCPDEGACHHGCPSAAACFRVACCGPLSGAYPGDRWPDGMAQAAREARSAGPPTAEDFIVGAVTAPEGD